jgi:glutamate/aspartate transport system substrate-binding protein
MVRRRPKSVHLRLGLAFAGGKRTIAPAGQARLPAGDAAAIAQGTRGRSAFTFLSGGRNMRYARALAAVAVAVSISVPAFGQALTGTLKKIHDTGTITIGQRDASIPFSYFAKEGSEQSVGYAMDICAKVVDAVKAAVGMPSLKVAYTNVTSATRIPLIANGTIDLECGSTTNNLDRQKQVAFTNTYFITANRYVAKKSSNIKTLNDLKGKTVVSTSGTTNIKWLTETNGAQNMGMNIIPAKDHAEAFLMVETGRAVAFFMDDILLYSLVASSKSPGDFEIGSEAYSVEPYGAMMPKDDPDFAKVVNTATANLFKSGEINAIYDKWFLKPIPPRGITLNVPMSATLKRVLANPTNSGDPADYK